MKKLLFTILMLMSSLTMQAGPHKHVHGTPKNPDEALDFIIDLFCEENFKICHGFAKYCSQLAPLLMKHEDARVQEVGKELGRLSKLNVLRLGIELKSGVFDKYKPLFTEYMAKRAAKFLEEDVLAARLAEALRCRN